MFEKQQGQASFYLTNKFFSPSRLVGPIPGFGFDTDGYTPKPAV